MPKVSLLAVVAALVAVGCGADSPTTAPSPQPAHGTPSRIELSATPGVGEHGGTATVTARVLDAYALLLPDVSVTFGADAGTFDAATATTTANGIATTTLAAPPGVVKVTATAGSVRTPDVSVAVQPPLGPTTTPLPPQPPTTQPRPPNSPPPTDLPFLVTIVATAAPSGSSTLFDLNVSASLATATWTFGDGAIGTTTTQHTGHTYASAGSYAVHVSATDTKGRTATDSTVVAIVAPSYTVTLAAAPTSVVAGGTATLTATVAFVGLPPAVTTWAWDCGNGTFAATPNTAICTYPTVGSFTAKVTVTGGTTSGSATTPVTVTAPPAPVIAVHCAPTGLTANCNFSATINGAIVATADIVSADWDWGDGATTTVANSPIASHLYASALTYQVVVRNATVNGTTAKGTGSTPVTVP